VCATLLAGGTMNKKQMIMEEALKLFATEGYESTGVALIVEKAEVTKPTLYHYFGNKEGLLRSIYEERFIPFLGALNSIQLDEGDIQSSFHKIFDCYLKHSQMDEPFFWLVNHLRKAPQKSESYGIVKTFYAQEEDLLNRWMQKISEQHKNLKGQEAFLTLNCLSLINGFIEVMILRNELMQSSQLDTQRLTKQFLYGIYSL
jgi:AcrR family transcriptional regulator